MLLLVASALASSEPLRLSRYPYVALAEVEANADPKRRGDEDGSERALSVGRDPEAAHSGRSSMGAPPGAGLR